MQAKLPSSLTVLALSQSEWHDIKSEKSHSYKRSIFTFSHSINRIHGKCVLVLVNIASPFADLRRFGRLNPQTGNFKGNRCLLSKCLLTNTKSDKSAKGFCGCKLCYDINILYPKITSGYVTFISATQFRSLKVLCQTASNNVCLWHNFELTV